MTLHLVRHAAPAIDPEVEPASWPLDPEHTGEVARLARSGFLPDDERARWCSSPEPKAVHTAGLLTDALARSGAVEVVDDLREQHRPAGWVDDFAVRNHRSLVCENVPSASGWESSASTRERVAGAARALIADTAGDLVLVGHGTAWILLVSELTSRPVDLAAWERMGLPDHCALEGGKVVVPWGAWQRR